MVTITRIQKVDESSVLEDVSADFVVVTIKDQFISRGEMHYFQRSLLGRWIYEGERLTDSKTVRYSMHGLLFQPSPAFVVLTTWHLLPLNFWCIGSEMLRKRNSSQESNGKVWSHHKRYCHHFPKYDCTYHVVGANMFWDVGLCFTIWNGTWREWEFLWHLLWQVCENHR